MFRLLITFFKKSKISDIQKFLSSFLHKSVKFVRKTFNEMLKKISASKHDFFLVFLEKIYIYFIEIQPDSK